MWKRYVVAAVLTVLMCPIVFWFKNLAQFGGRAEVHMILSVPFYLLAGIASATCLLFITKRSLIYESNPWWMQLPAFCAFGVLLWAVYFGGIALVFWSAPLMGAKAPMNSILVSLIASSGALSNVIGMYAATLLVSEPRSPQRAFKPYR